MVCVLLSYGHHVTTHVMCKKTKLQARIKPTALCLAIDKENSIEFLLVSQTSFGHISINSSTILMVSKATESPQKDLLINASHILRQSILAEILSRSTGNHHVTVY